MLVRLRTRAHWLAPQLRTFFASQSHVWGFADQALISATNFVTMVLLARALGPSEFGTFILIYTLMLFANTVQNALFTQPHNVIASPLDEIAYARYTIQTFIAQFLFSGIICVAIALIGVWLLVAESSHGSAVLTLSFATLAWQMQELVRRTFYTRNKPRSALVNDIVNYGGQLLLLLVFWHLDVLSTASALLGIGLAASFGGSFGLLQSSNTFASKHKFSWGEWNDWASTNWRFGKWILGSGVLSWTAGQLYPILTAGLIGTAATGGMRAAQTVLGPTHILLKGVEAMILPKAAKSYADMGSSGLLSVMRNVSIPATAVMSSYCLMVFIFAEPLIHVLFGGAYTDYAWFLRVYAFYYILNLVSTLLSIILRSLNHTFPLFQAQLCAAVATLTLGLVVVHTFALIGTAMGLLCSNLVAVIILIYATRSTLAK